MLGLLEHLVLRHRVRHLVLRNNQRLLEHLQGVGLAGAALHAEEHLAEAAPANLTANVKVLEADRPLAALLGRLCQRQGNFRLVAAHCRFARLQPICQLHRVEAKVLDLEGAQQRPAAVLEGIREEGVLLAAKVDDNAVVVVVVFDFLDFLITSAALLVLITTALLAFLLLLDGGQRQLFKVLQSREALGDQLGDHRHPVVPFVAALRDEGPLGLQAGGPLERTAQAEAVVVLLHLHLHDASIVQGKVIQRIVVDARRRPLLEAQQAAVVQQDQVPTSPVGDVLTCQERVISFDKFQLGKFSKPRQDKLPFL